MPKYINWIFKNNFLETKTLQKHLLTPAILNAMYKGLIKLRLTNFVVWIETQKNLNNNYVC